MAANAQIVLTMSRTRTLGKRLSKLLYSVIRMHSGQISLVAHGVCDVKEEKGDISMIVKHNKGCHCKKSGCLKKYSECFQVNVLCSENCKCMYCKNYDGSEDRRALFHEEHSNHSNAIYMQQVAANAAITRAIGSSGYGSPPISKKRKLHVNFFPTTAKDSHVHRLA